MLIVRLCPCVCVQTKAGITALADAAARGAVDIVTALLDDPRTSPSAGSLVCVREREKLCMCAVACVR